MAEVEEEEVVDLRMNHKRADGTPYKSELLDLPTPSPPLSPTYVPAPFRTLRPWEDDSVRKQTPEKSLFEKYNESLQEQYNKPKESLITRKLLGESNALKNPEAYTQPFCDFLTENPTVWHAVTYFEKKLEKAGFKKVCCLVLVLMHH
jgi:aminopeptidase I